MIDLNGKKVLLVRNDNIGDLICTTPAIEALKKHYSQAEVDIVVNSYNRMVLDGFAFIDRIYSYTKPKHRKSIYRKIAAGAGKTAMLWQIRKKRYDAVVIFRGGYSRSAELFAKIAGAPIRIGVKNPKGEDTITHPVNPQTNRHEVEFCFDCLAHFGIDYDGEKTYFPIELQTSQTFASYHDAILFHISSRVAENRYDMEKFRQLFLHLKDRRILVSAEPQDCRKALWLQEQTHATFIPTSSLKELAALVHRVERFVTLDGGALHIGPAVGTPTIALIGKTDISRWHPWGYRDLTLSSPTDRAADIPIDAIIEKIEEID